MNPLSILMLTAPKWVYALIGCALLTVTSWGCGCSYGRNHPGLLNRLKCDCKCSDGEPDKHPFRPFRSEAPDVPAANDLPNIPPTVGDAPITMSDTPSSDGTPNHFAAKSKFLSEGF